MSYHRVLPRPLPLSNEDLASRWAVGQDPLKKASIMTHEGIGEPLADRGLSSSSLHQDATTKSARSVHGQANPSTLQAVPLKLDSDIHERSPPLEQKPPSSAVEAWEGDIPGPICLCQPDPKVPRPRNAFILYRQHHQASIVAQNPGLPNPEISKVIGDHWRTSPPEVKEHWKLLAEEEKLRHQKQYPDYRYQPRRAGRTGSVNDSSQGPSSSLTDNNRCAKCGGKSISSSYSMGSHTTNPGQSSPTMSYHVTREQTLTMPPPPTASNTAATRLSRPPASPATRDGSAHAYHFSHPQSGHVIPLSSPRHIKRPPELMSPGSPDTKRRRLPDLSHGQSRMLHGPYTPLQMTHAQQRHSSLSYPNSSQATLASPSTMSVPSSSIHGQSRLRSESLRLPPLHTPAATHTHSRSGSDDVAGMQTLGAMIHSIPLLGKIKLLGKVAGPPPLTPFPSSPYAFERRKGRGPIICVDSADAESATLIVDVLKRNLESDCNVKVFTVKETVQSTKVTMQSYLRLIDNYHDLSQEVKAHVTPPPVSTESVNEARKISSVSRQLSSVDLKNVDREQEAMDTATGSPPSPKTSPEISRGSLSSSTEKHEDMDVDSPRSNDVRLPVAILPGWHLTQTDYFAINVPITDSYSPVDHWQWHLTFWRGVVGADATIAVQPAVAEEPQTSPPVTAASSVGTGLNTAGSIQDSSTRHAGVSNAQKKSGTGIDIRLEDAKAIILQAGDKGAVVESVLRRVGFEIGEWIRGWSEREAC